MNNEIIILIVCFVTNVIVSVFIAILVVLLFKRTVHNSGPNNNNVYSAKQIKELLTKYCKDGSIKMKDMSHPSTLENGEYRIFRPKRFKTSLMPLELRMRSVTPHLFGIETLGEASSKTTESIIEYIDTVKQFVRSDTFTSLSTSEKQYIVIRIEEQLCKIIFKYVDGDIDKLCEDDKTIILNALNL